MKRKTGIILGGIVATFVGIGFLAANAHPHFGPHGPGFARGAGPEIGFVANKILDQFETNISPNAEQEILLNDVRAAVTRAETNFKSEDNKTFTHDSPTPQKLAFLEAKLEGALKAVKEIRPSVDALYSSLDEEQRETVDTMGPPHRSGPRHFKPAE